MPRLLSIVLTVAIVGASGCNRIEWGYTWLDWVLEAQAERYLDLDAEQEKAAEVAADDYLRWHRRVMLPRYAAYLRGLSGAQRAGAFDAPAYQRAARDFEALLADTLRALAPPVAALLTSQRFHQLDHFREQLDQRHEELIAEGRDSGDERHDDTFDTLEDLVGKLTLAQRRAVGDRLDDMQADREIWLHERRRRNARLVTELRNGIKKAELSPLLIGWWTGRHVPPTPEYAAYQKRFRGQLHGMLGDLFTNLNKDQRLTLADSLDAYAKAFENLALEVQARR